jgi:hypothetical protein
VPSLPYAHREDGASVDTALLRAPTRALAGVSRIDKERLTGMATDNTRDERCQDEDSHQRPQGRIATDATHRGPRPLSEETLRWLQERRRQRREGTGHRPVDMDTIQEWIETAALIAEALEPFVKPPEG